MKKYIAIFFTTVALACLLTGCGKENKTNEENNGTITEITSGEINSEKEIENNEDLVESISLINSGDIKKLEVIKELELHKDSGDGLYYSGEYADNGVERKIKIEFLGVQEDDFVTTTYEVDIDGAKRKVNFDADGKFYIVDVDKNDKYVELVATSNPNESDVTSNVFYRYVDGEIVELGKVSNFDGIEMKMYQNKILGMPVYFGEGALVGSYYIIKDNKIENVKTKYEDVKDKEYTVTADSIDYVLETEESTSNLKNIRIGDKIKIEKINYNSDYITENDYTVYMRARIQSGDEVVIQNPLAGVSF